MIEDLKSGHDNQGASEKNSGRDFYDLLTDPKLNMEDLARARETGSIDDKQYDTLKQALMERLRL